MKLQTQLFQLEIKKILQDKKAIPNTFINYFIDVTHSLGLKKNIGLENCEKLSKFV